MLKKLNARKIKKIIEIEGHVADCFSDENLSYHCKKYRAKNIFDCVKCFLEHPEDHLRLIEKENFEFNSEKAKKKYGSDDLGVVYNKINPNFRDIFEDAEIERKNIERSTGKN